MLSFKLYHPKPGSPLQLAPGAACDQCRRKKAKCNRQKPCEGCRKSQISCSYNTIPKTRGRKRRACSRTETSNHRSSPTTSDVAWESHEPVQTSDDIPLSPFWSEWNIANPQLLTSRSDMTFLPEMESELFNDCNTSQKHCETDVSTNCTSPLSHQQQESVEPYLGEAVSPLEYPQAHTVHGAHTGGWINGDGPDSNLPSFIMLHRSIFLPYVQIFFDRLYPVFPIVDRDGLMALLKPESHEEQPLPIGLYSFFTALSAAVVVQLNVADLGLTETETSTFDQESDSSSTKPQPSFSAEFFMSHCMQARRHHDFIEDPDEWTILTSFFLFAYHGNLDQSRSAWYYLREAIGFVQALRLDESESYIGVDVEVGQRRRRLFWLLFITERAFALQHRRRAVLRPTIDLPRVFESRDPRLTYGFVALAKVFASVDELFITAWSDQSSPGSVSKPQSSSQSIAKLLRHNDEAGVLSGSEIEETQHLDIMITQHWLRVLACQLQKQLLLQSFGTKDRHAAYLRDGLSPNTHCVLDTSRSLLEVLTSASPESLEPHGIGMEQKVSDVANCLCDVLESLDVNELSVDYCSAPQSLHHFMVFLTSFRNHESQYLQPLVNKASNVLAARLRPALNPTIDEGKNDMPKRTELQESDYIDEGLGLLV